MIPPVPNQNTAPAFAPAVLFSNVHSLILPPVAPSFQSIAPPLIEAVLFTKIHLVKSLSCEDSRYTAPPKPSRIVKLVTEFLVKLLS